MRKLIQKVKDYFEVRRLKKHIKYLDHYRGCIQHDMHFGNPTDEEVIKANRKLNSIELEKRITQGLLYSYDV